MWDWIITIIILVTFALSIWAKVSKQTIPQLLGEIKDRLSDNSEEVQENLGVDIYE